MRTRDRRMILILVLACLALLALRSVGAPRSAGLPQRHYELIIDMGVEGSGQDVVVRSYLPLHDDRQIVRNEIVTSGEFGFVTEREGENRVGVWDEPRLVGPRSIVYSGTVRTSSRKYELDPALVLPTDHPAAVARYLEPDERIQSDSPEIVELTRRLAPDAATAPLARTLRLLFDHAHETIRPAEFSGTTDALTCSRLGEASCGGKSRLFVAMARAVGLPARLVGGLILKNGSWRTTHIWAEIWIEGYWVPFCPLNGHFAELPENYLATYIGDRPQFVHTRDINFRHVFTAHRILAPPPGFIASVGPAGLSDLWSAFERVRIPVDLLKIILMIPFGALAVVVFRNFVGIDTFGTFMPALIAVAFRDTGLVWGLTLFSLVLLVGALARFGLDRFQLLHTPRLAVILSLIVMVVLGVALVGAATGRVLPTRISLFPLAILTLTVERLATMLEQEGPTRSLTVVAGTFLVASAAYAVMEWETLQVMALAFPELLLLVIAGFFAAGRWSGMCLVEYLRFRELLRRSPVA